MDLQFADRRDAGRQLAQALTKFKGADAVVLALPRGGVPVAYELAVALDLPLEVFIVRKLGMPGHREFAIGAIASGGTQVLSQELLDELHVPAAAIDAVIAEELAELARRELMYHTAPLTLRDRIAILVDDGLATGSTMKAAVRAVRQQGPSQIVVAVPVGAPDSCEMLRREADEVTCLRTPYSFSAVGQWYRRFDQTTDEEVRTLLDAARARQLTPR